MALSMVSKDAICNWYGSPTFAPSVRGKILARLSRHAHDKIQVGWINNQIGPPWCTKDEVEAMIEEEGKFFPLPIAIDSFPIRYCYEIEVLT